MAVVYSSNGSRDARLPPPQPVCQLFGVGKTGDRAQEVKVVHIGVDRKIFFQ